MRSVIQPVAALALISTMTFSIGAKADLYKADAAHSGAHFEVRHHFTKVRGSFNQIEGQFQFDPKKQTASDVQFTVKATSIDTANEKRDEHLKSPDFFDAGNHPELKFKSTKVTKAGKNKFKMAGDLTLRGTTKPTTWDVEFLGTGKNMMGQEMASFTATTKINRKDYGISWSKVLDGGGIVVGDEVKLEINVEAIKDAPTDAAAAASATAESKAAATPAPEVKGTEKKK